MSCWNVTGLSQWANVSVLPHQADNLPGQPFPKLFSLHFSHHVHEWNRDSGAQATCLCQMMRDGRRRGFFFYCGTPDHFVANLCEVPPVLFHNWESGCSFQLPLSESNSQPSVTLYSQIRHSGPFSFLTALIDSGAGGNFIDHDTVLKLLIQPFQHPLKIKNHWWMIHCNWYNNPLHQTPPHLITSWVQDFELKQSSVTSTTLGLLFTATTLPPAVYIQYALKQYYV